MASKGTTRRPRCRATPRPIIRVSGKNLGSLALPGCCDRCAWLKLKSGFRLPWQVFPGIFSSIDSFTKKVVHGYFDGHGCAPPWLAELGDLTGYIDPPHYSKFNYTDERHGILLTGAPDAVFVRQRHALCIGDYKTARFTAHQDELLPMYAVQLNVYAMIAERTDMGRVSDLALIYMEPQTAENAAAGRGHDDGFDMGFTAHVLSIDLDLSMIDPLLVRVRELYDMDTAPPARSGCPDCARFAELISLGAKRRNTP